MIRKINRIKLLLGLLFLTFCLPNLDIIKIGEHGLKVYRLISILYLPWLLSKKHIELPSKPIFIFLIYMVINSVYNFLFLGFERLLLDYIYAFYILVLVYNLGKKLSQDEWISIIKTVAITSLIIVFLNLLKNIDEIIYFFKNQYNEHPSYKFIFTGGPNLEATWIGLFGFFFKDDKKGYIYIVFCTIVSVLLSSRAGIIIDVIVFIFLSFSQTPNRKDLIKKNRLLIMILMVIISGVIAISTGVADKLLGRLTNINSNPGSQGRIHMWRNVWEAFIYKPMGYGAGNAIRGLNMIADEFFLEDNVHNLFLQMLLDLGIIGFVFYFIIVSKFLLQELENFFTNPFTAFLITYILIGFIQFKGAEIIIFYILAVYLLLRNNNKNERKQNIKNGAREDKRINDNI